MLSFTGLYLNDFVYPRRIVNLLTKLHDYHGKQELYTRQSPEILKAMQTIATIQSVESSNRLEGILVPVKKIESLLSNKSVPKNRSESEVAGYRDVLATIHASHEYIPLTPNAILQFHRDLMKLATNTGGRFKTTDNVIKETHSDGAVFIRFTPVPAWKTPESVTELCNRFNQEKDNGQIDPLILIALFVLDFLCIHPFADGNGRMARLITLLLLYKCDFLVGKYVSLEKAIEETKEQYYETLYLSSQNWHEGKHDAVFWVEYFLTVLLRTYQRFEERVGSVKQTVYPKGWKEERIREVIKHTIADFSVSELMERCPGISRPTFARVLNQLRNEGQIECIEHGRNARWKKI